MFLQGIGIETSWWEEGAMDEPTEERELNVDALLDEEELTLYDVAIGAGGDSLQLSIKLTPELVAAINQHVAALAS